MSKILMVEDDELFSNMYKKKFDHEGLELEVAQNGDEGWKKIQSLKPALVILDMMLPGISGTEILKRVKADASLKETPVIVMTNLNASSEELSEAIGLGIAETVLKTSVTPAQIVELAKKHMRKE